MKRVKKSLLLMLVVLALIACRRAPAAPTEGAPSPTRAQAEPTATASPAPTKAVPSPTPVLNTKPSRPVSASEVPRITVDELKALLSSARNVVVVDTRGRDAYAAAHIRGALDIPYDQVEAAAPQLSRSAKIVFYCA